MPLPSLRHRTDARIQLLCLSSPDGSSAFVGVRQHLPPWIEVCTEAAALDRPFALFLNSSEALHAFQTARDLHLRHGLRPLQLFIFGSCDQWWREQGLDLPITVFETNISSDKIGDVICRHLLEKGLTAPAQEEVQVWRVDLEPPSETVDRLRPLLSPDETRRAGAFFREADRIRHIVTRGALRTLLGRYGNIAPTEIEFTYSLHHKPACPRLWPIQFNVAHSGTLALIAFAHSQSVGVDVEQIRPGLDYIEIGGRVFTPVELHELERRGPERLMDSFYQLWSRKEAYLKCSGEGFLGSPEKTHVGLAPSRVPVKSFVPLHGYAAALAVERAWNYVTFRDWRLDFAA
jgi:4'-phosphopantetheinyl transferase